MIASETRGSIVFTASMSGFVVNTPQPHPAYAVSKSAVHHLARSLAGEWVGHRIRVNSISPGIMNTRLSGGPAQSELRKLWLEKSPMGIGEPEDLTGAVVLLCSEASKFMTGIDIKLDGDCILPEDRQHPTYFSQAAILCSKTYHNQCCAKAMRNVLINTQFRSRLRDCFS